MTTFFSDDALTLARYQHAPDASFDYAPAWFHDSIAAAFRSGAARMGITGANPALLAEQDPAKVSRANMAASKASKPAMEMVTRHEINWTIVAAATPAWAALVFPGEPEPLAVGKLWDAIFRLRGLLRLIRWRSGRQHGAALKARVDFLNEKRFHSLRFYHADDATDLTVGLADQHLWAGGGTTAGNGIYCQPNIPTEECFTTPHYERVNGHVAASKPLSHQGTLIENIRCTFEDGKIVEATATCGRSGDQQTDLHGRRCAAAWGKSRWCRTIRRLRSRVCCSGTRCLTRMRRSHIALGQAYSTCLIGGEKMSNEELAKLGANESLIHVDWMIGGPGMSVDGVSASGVAEPLMRLGDWV